MKQSHLIAASIAVGISLVTTVPVANAKPNVVPGEFTAQKILNGKSNTELREERKKRREQRRLLRQQQRSKPKT